MSKLIGVLGLALMGIELPGFAQGASPAAESGAEAPSEMATEVPARTVGTRFTYVDQAGDTFDTTVVAVDGDSVLFNYGGDDGEEVSYEEETSGYLLDGCPPYSYGPKARERVRALLPFEPGDRTVLPGLEDGEESFREATMFSVLRTYERDMAFGPSSGVLIMEFTPRFGESMTRTWFDPSVGTIARSYYGDGEWIELQAISQVDVPPEQTERALQVCSGEAEIAETE